MTKHTVEYAAESGVAHLRGLTEETWARVVDHRFVHELFAGTVARAHMAKYLIQDYQFFESFVGMLGACVAHADTLEAKLRFAAQLGMLAGDENSYFTDAFSALSVGEEQVASPELTEVTREFRRTMDAAASSGNYAQLLAVLVVCEWIYLDWGEREDLGMPGNAGAAAEDGAGVGAGAGGDVYSGWIELHRGGDFRGWVQFLVNELERVMPSGSGPALRDVEQVFKRVVDLELAFFDSVYE